MPAFVKCLFLTLISLNTMGQESLQFEIRTKLFKLGDATITKYKISNSDSTHYKLVSELRVWSFYEINYLMESVYVADTLCYSLTSIRVNDISYYYCSTTSTNKGYVVKSLQDNILLTHYKPIISSITPLYFGNYHGPDSIFSEYSGKYRPFIAKNDSTYILDPADPMEFTFAHGKIAKVMVPNRFMDFYIVLKPNFKE